MELEDAEGAHLSTNAHGCGQAVFEICTRAAAVVFSVCALVSSSIAFGTLDSVPSDAKDIIDDKSKTEYNDSDLPVTPDIVRNTRITCGWIVSFSVVTIILQILITFLCCFNVGLITTSTKTKKVRIIDIVLSVVLGLGFMVGVVTATFFLFDWNDWVDAVDETPNIFEEDEKDPHDFAAIRNALGVTAGACLLSMSIFGLLIVRITSILFSMFKCCHRPSESEHPTKRQNSLQ